jgi:methionyl-tRNA synthetase
MPDKFYLTTPIYYVNARPHIGTTYTTVVADAIARRKRTLGIDTFFLTGTDEHGQKIERSAAKAGCSPQEFTDQVSAQFRGLWDRMGLTYDDFIRTTEPRHQQAVQKLFTLLKDRGYIYKGSYSGQYCVSDEAYVDVPPGAPCPDCGRITETVNEENYYFKLSAFERKLLEFYDEHPEFIRPETRRNEVISFVRSGLRDLSVSRTSFSWGIPVPGDEKHVIYVWMDALANYITALGWGSDDPSKFEKFWPADLHIVGKEITRFHCVYWPAFLMAAGLPLPKRVTSNGWWLMDGEKMSKSLGNVVEPRKLAEIFGLDPIRYFLLREKPFGADGSLSHAAIISRINVDLANDLGNLAQRTLSLVARNCAGALPPRGPATEDDTALLAAAENLLPLLRQHIDRQTFHDGLEEIWKVIRAANGYIDRQAPWALNRTDKTRMGEVLRVLVDTIRVVATLLQPVMPGSMALMLDQLGVPPEGRSFVALETPLTDGQTLPPPQGVFPRYVEPVA